MANPYEPPKTNSETESPCKEQDNLPSYLGWILMAALIVAVVFKGFSPIFIS